MAPHVQYLTAAVHRYIARLFPRPREKPLFDVPVERWRGLANAFTRFPEPPSILVLKVDHIGDFVMALEGCSRLRAAWPAAAITLVCGPWNVDLAHATGLFDRIVAFDFYPPSESIAGPPARLDKLQSFAELGLGPFDLAMDLRSEPDTRPLLRLLRATFRAGFAAPEERDILDLVLHDTELAARSGGFPPLHGETRITVLVETVIATFKAPGRLADRLAGRRTGLARSVRAPDVVICVASGAPLKRWPTKKFGELATRLVGEGYRIVLAGGREDAREADTIAAGLPATACTNLAGRMTLVELAPILAGSSLYVGLDTGVTHLAAYLEVPTLILYSGTNDPRVWMPRGPSVTALRPAPVCSPCGRRELHECSRAIACIAEISSDQAFATARELLSDMTSRPAPGHPTLS